MNILIVCHYGLYLDLTASFVHNQAKAYAALGHRVRVIIPVPEGKRCQGKRFGPGLSIREADGVGLYYCRYLSLSNWGVKRFNTPSAISALKPRLSTLLQGFRPDVIHAHTLGLDSQIGAWLKEQLGCPLVVTTHGSDTSIPMEQGRGAEMNAFCGRADHIVAVSSVLGDKLRACGTNTPITSILNGFTLHPLGAAEPKEPCSCIQVGNLLKQKRADITLRAFVQIRERNPGATLTLIGQGPEQAALERLCGELGVSDAVRFTGQVPNQTVLAEMTRAQFFVMPSVREGFGIVYLEAMASGCLTIGTEGEGIADLIVSGENGFLVPPDDPDAIVQIIEWCLAHPEETAAIAEQGRRDARSLTWETNASQYIALFQELLER